MSAFLHKTYKMLPNLPSVHLQILTKKPKHTQPENRRKKKLLDLK